MCRVFHKSTGIKKTSIQDLLRVNSFGDEFLDYSSLPPLMDPPQSSRPGSSSFNDEDDDEFKAITSKSLGGNYMPHLSTTMVNNNQSYLHQQQLPNSSYQTPSSVFYPQIPASNPFLTFQTTPNLASYFPNSIFGGNDQTHLSRSLAANSDTSVQQKKHCKLEQFSSNNQSVATHSQDTGLSTDRNTTTEISSVVSKHEIRSNKVYDDLEGPSSVGAIADFEGLWDY